MSILSNINKIEISIGYEITGRWNNNKYKIVRKLGSGENGVVFLVKADEKLYALKMSESSFDISYEIKAIQSLNKTQGPTLGFSIFDVDDLVYKNTNYSFYIMPYQNGITLSQYLYGKGDKEYFIMFKQIVKLINLFHQQGYIFGDLKPEHIIIDSENKSISLIDFGGVTKINEGVRQFTEIFDRGSWRMGSRRADPHYDFYSIAMIFTYIGCGKNKVLKIYNNSRSIKNLYDIIHKSNTLRLMMPIIKDIINGRRKNYIHIWEGLSYLEIDNGIKNKSKLWINWLLVFSSAIFVLALISYILNI